MLKVMLMFERQVGGLYIYIYLSVYKYPTAIVFGNSIIF